MAGAALLSWLGEQYISIVNPLLAVFGMLLGACILRKAYLRHIQKKKVKMWAYLPSQAILSIFFGGDGWGNLATRGREGNFLEPADFVETVFLKPF